jgi:hypothetical protein
VGGFPPSDKPELRCQQFYFVIVSPVIITKLDL